jgi:hypothetical protein
MLMNKKHIILLVLVACGSYAMGQSKDEIAILANSRQLHKTVFGTKDSITLDGLFAKTLTYGHSNGRIQNRAEAVDGIIHNKSTYTDSSLKSYNITVSDDVAVVRYVMRETETNAEGKPAPLRLAIMLVWVEEKGKWKLLGRQAVRLAE